MRKLMVMGPLLLMVLLAWTPGISFTEDLGRHLLLGRIILAEHAVPHTNLLTYTHPDFPFVNHHWLSEVILYVLHRFVGLNGLIVWKMLMMAAALGLALATVKTERSSSLLWVAGLLAAVMMGYRAHIRPELFTYLFVALYLWLFERIREGRGWARWALLPVALLWANLHIYFVFGLGMILAFCTEQWLCDRRDPKSGIRNSEFLWAAAALAVSLVNPNGARGLLYPFTIFANYGIRIAENASPMDCWHTVVNPMLLALPVLTVIVLWAVFGPDYTQGRRGPPPRLANMLTAVAAMLATWGMARSAPLLAITGMPVVAAACGGAEVWGCGSKKERPHTPSCPRASILRYVMFAASAFLNVLLCIVVISGKYSRVFPSPIGPTPFGFDDEARYQRLRSLRANFGLKGPVFTDYNIGSLVEYQLYPEPGYCDNRPEAFPASFWRTEYLPALALAEDWQRIREARRINVIIVSTYGVKEAYCQELMRRPLWVLVHADELACVWTRNVVENGPIINARAFNEERLASYEDEIAGRLAQISKASVFRRQVELERVVYDLYTLLCIGQGQRIWPHLKQIHDRYPDYQIVHELMRVSVPPDEAPFLEAIMARRARWPVAAKQALDWGHHLLAMGDPDQARRVFLRGRFFFPLNTALRDALRGIQDQEYWRMQDALDPHRPLIIDH